MILDQLPTVTSGCPILDSVNEECKDLFTMHLRFVY